VTKEKKRIEFHIDPGTEDGERIALKGEGDAAVGSASPTHPAYTASQGIYVSQR